MRSLWKMACLLGALLVLAGCGSPAFFAATPPGFVELEDQEPAFHYRAVSADGVVIGVRQIKHEPKGDRAFWERSISNQMRDRAGYALLSTDKVKTKSGLDGVQMKYGRDEKGKTMLYTLTIFVTEKHIFLVEFGGSKEEMTRQQAHLAWVIENFRLT